MRNQHKCTSNCRCCGCCHEWNDTSFPQQHHQPCRCEEANQNERRWQKNRQQQNQRPCPHQQRRRRIRWSTKSLSVLLLFLSSTTTITKLLLPVRAQTGVPSIVRSAPPVVTTSPKPSLVPSESPAPTPVPSWAPTGSPFPTEQPTIAPSPAPTTAAPSAFPTESPQPTMSDPPSAIPSVFPSPFPTESFVPTGSPSTSAPTITGVPSSVPSEAPSSNPSSPLPTTTYVPSQQPSQIPTLSPTDTLAPSPSPSVFPTMQPSNTFRPSSTPSMSFFPTVSSVPSLTPSSNPSSLPSSMPSEPPPTVSPTFSPSSFPTSSPSSFPSQHPSGTPSQFPTRFLTNASRVIEITMSGMQNLTNETDRKEWEDTTSKFVAQYWRERDNTGITIDDVTTILETQEVITPTNKRRIMQGNGGARSTTISIFLYEQLISFGITNHAIIDPSDGDSTSESLDEIFTRPFHTSSQLYVDQLKDLSDTPEFLRVLATDVVAVNPPGVPTAAPSGGKKRLTDGAIVGIVAAVFLIVAGFGIVGYHSYQMKKREGEYIVRDHTASPPTSSNMSAMGYPYDVGHAQNVFNPQSSAVVHPSSSSRGGRTIHSGAMNFPGGIAADTNDIMDPNFHANSFAIGATSFGSHHAREFGPDVVTPLPVVGEYGSVDGGGGIAIQEATNGAAAAASDTNNRTTASDTNNNNNNNTTVGGILSDEEDTHALAPPEEIIEEGEDLDVVNELLPGEEHDMIHEGVIPILDSHTIHSYGTTDSADRQPSMSAFQLEIHDLDDM